MKRCSQCELEKDFSDFHKCKNCKNGVSAICNKCRSVNRNKEKHVSNDGNLICFGCGKYKCESEFPIDSKKFYRNFRNTKCKSCKQESLEKRRNERRDKSDSIDRLITERFCGVRDRAKKNGLVLDFDREYIKQLWVQQNGICAISGIQMTHQIYSGRVFTNLSVDRIDSNKGYIKGNIQLVCMAINQMKSDLTMEELIYFCKNIIDNYES